MIIAGDIGATHSRVAAFRAEGNKFPLVVEKIYESQDHSGLVEIAGAFIRTEGIPAQNACFAVAGPVRGGISKISNLPWTIDSRELARQLNLRAVGLINDLEAFAYGLDSLESKDFITLHAGSEDAEGNTAVISAGTGLGEAGLLWDGFRQHPFACEGGHADFAARNDVQIELLKYLLARFKTVSYERVLAGPGIKNVYEFLRDTKRAEEPAWLREQMTATKDPAALISEFALDKKAPICEQTMSIFVSVYGAEAGNCALKFMSLGGIFIGGSIAAKNIPLMKRPEFLEAFFDKGRMRSLLEDMPVKIVLNDDAGLLGAARYACLQKAFGLAQWS
ncbi:MAG TPA: glucokinase [Terriglobales bacterium]|jgi:glucokinase|nr:glucokinase [Terriglobales bacterium]